MDDVWFLFFNTTILLRGSYRDVNMLLPKALVCVHFITSAGSFAHNKQASQPSFRPTNLTGPYSYLVSYLSLECNDDDVLLGLLAEYRLDGVWR